MRLKLRKRILSVDWDAFYTGVHQSEGYEWGEERQGLENVIWYIRAGSHLANERRLLAKEYKHQSFLPRLYSVDPRAWAFWPLISWRKKVTLHGADSHKDIWPHLELWARSTDDMSNLTIVNVDAHHDMGYGMTRVEGCPLNCGNWAQKAAFRGAHIEQVYIQPAADGRYLQAWAPGKRWVRKSLIQAVQEPFDGVFVCRSGAWVPPWLDTAFLGFLGASGLKTVGQVPARPFGPELWAQALESQRQMDEMGRHFAAHGVPEMGAGVDTMVGQKLGEMLLTGPALAGLEDGQA